MAPTWGHVLIVEHMRTLAYLVRLVPTHTEKNKLWISRVAHSPFVCMIKISKFQLVLKRKFCIFFKISKLTCNMMKANDVKQLCNNASRVK
jgi:hypothetical protein